MLPIFLVSLEHHQNRRDKVFAGLQKYGINDAIWFPAVNGNKEDLTKFNIDRSKHQRFWHNCISCCSYSRVYTNGEYGCALSHLHLYQKIVDENISAALKNDINTIVEPLGIHVVSFAITLVNGDIYKDAIPITITFTENVSGNYTNFSASGSTLTSITPLTTGIYNDMNKNGLSLANYESQI